MNILLALFLIAQGFAHRQNPGVPGGTPLTITNGATCSPTPAAGACVELDVRGTSAMLVTLTAGSGCPGANCTIQFACTKDNWATQVVIAADSFSNGSLAGAPATTTTSAGSFLMPTFAFQRCGVQASTYVSGTATVYLDSDPAFLPAIGATGAAALQVQGAAGGTPIGVTAAASSTAGTQIACNSGTSPCNITNSAANVLNANTSRKSCSLCPQDAQILFCKKATAAGSAASSTNFDFALPAPGAGVPGGTCWHCDTAGAAWQGPVNCIASAGTAAKNLSVEEEQ